MRKFLVLILSLALLAGVAYVGYQRWGTLKRPDDPLAGVQTATVERGTIVATVFVVGNVAPSREAHLVFATVGRVATVNVEVGDAVETGQILASLETTDLELNVSNAELTLAISEAELTKLKKGPPEKDLAAAEAALKAAQDRLTTLQAGPRESEIAAARAALDAAQATYNLLVSQPSPEIIRQAELQVEFARNALWQAQSQRDAACGAERATKSTCDAFEAAVGNAHVQIEQANLALEQAKSPASQAELQNARSQVQLAQRNLDSLLTGPSAAEIAAAEAQVAQAQAQLDRLTTGPSPEDLQIAEMRADQAKLALQLAQKTLADAFLKAPFDGVVTTLNYRPGDVVRPERVGIVLADLSQLEIRVNVAEIDIGQIQIGQEAEIELDALPDQVLSGTVTQIAPAARSELGVVNYPITVAMAVNDPRVKPGLTGNVNIITGRREEVLLVPNRAIRQRRGQHVVVVLRGDQLAEKRVQLGLSNDSVTEIVSGLETGEQVVLNVTTIQSGLSGGLFSGQ